MKKRLLNNIRNIIIKENKKISDDSLEEIMYGIEGFILTIEKLVVILIISFILNIIKEVLMLILFFNIIRFFSFGVHAKSSIICLISSIIIFIGVPLLSKIIVINKIIKIILLIILPTYYLIYAPSDTEKRPIISKRIMYKTISVIINVIYISISFIITNNVIVNLLIFSLIIESILINPLTYKLFKVSYNNYKNYQKEVQ